MYTVMLHSRAVVAPNSVSVAHTLTLSPSTTAKGSSSSIDTTKKERMSCNFTVSSQTTCKYLTHQKITKHQHMITHHQWWITTHNNHTEAYKVSYQGCRKGGRGASEGIAPPNIAVEGGGGGGLSPSPPSLIQVARVVEF